MDHEPIMAGVSPGGFQDVYEVRILICYLLASVDSQRAVKLYLSGKSSGKLLHLFQRLVPACERGAYHHKIRRKRRILFSEQSRGGYSQNASKFSSPFCPGSGGLCGAGTFGVTEKRTGK